ncbi:L-serine ammonia-lyase (plasmid) [Pseudonocardia bannensis]|uniref:L-serine dehydratase n=1 Tax=Pseudonocardia bannensis TaxID=630973 RepID=A0A848DMV2_9PSEU|nr:MULTISPECIES: L-serine ammonia-lyase [Pseudonocardia]NMH93816.1 L-serine ammonia-lyase [Pseudonocardia bannensis]
MAVSAFDLFSIGIGPSSSHTVGPMKAARMFVERLAEEGLLGATAAVRTELFGSLGATGHGHGSAKAVLLGLTGARPDTVDVDTADAQVEHIRRTRRVPLLGHHEIDFDERRDLVLHRRRSLPGHPNGMRLAAHDVAGGELLARTYYSVGGGFVREDLGGGDAGGIVADDTPVRFPYRSATELLAHCTASGLPISGVMLANELSWRSEDQVRAGLLRIWQAMQDCVRRGCEREGVLPGGLKVRRRAPGLYRTLQADAGSEDPLKVMDWLSLYALAVNEENASGGRVVTAPTNGAAGIVPAVLHHYHRTVPGADDDGVVRFLLTAAAIGVIYKECASISGAEVGCQGEVGSACSMAAGALCEVLGGSPQQVENAAEIGMEHHLGLTCDPVGGLVQIPCIERNAMAAVRAIHAARLALHGDGVHIVSLDNVIATMRETGADMKVKYKETSRGGLAVNIIEC